MGSESELREEIAAERRQLTDAVASLRTELEHTAETGKKVGAALGAALAARMLIRRLRRRNGN
jgi:hypothetical protein